MLAELIKDPDTRGGPLITGLRFSVLQSPGEYIGLPQRAGLEDARRDESE